MCCIVGLGILMVVGRLRRLLGLGRSGETTVLFAPVARRPAPGQPPLCEPSPVIESRSEPVSVLRYCALAVAVCLIGVPVLALSGVVQNTGSATAWSVRSACYLAVIVVALALSRSIPLWRAPRGVGTLLIVLGAVIFELGVLDMHAFGLFDFAGPNMMGDMVFHNLGPVIAMAGGLALLYGSSGRNATSWRSPRSTDTVARPEPSAVTVSSTPPITA